MRDHVAPEHTYRLPANNVPHTVHVFAHGPHILALAKDAGEAAIWTTLAASWMTEQRRRAGLEDGDCAGPDTLTPAAI